MPSYSRSGPDDTALSAPGPVVMRYTGPPVTVWAAAHLIAEALMAKLPRTFAAAGDADRHKVETAMIAYAITVVANSSGAVIPDTDTVASPQVFADVPVLAVAQLLRDELNLSLALIDRSGHWPAVNDPGAVAFLTWLRLVDTDGASVGEVTGDVLADPNLKQRVDDDIRVFRDHAQRAYRAVIFGALRLRPDPQDTNMSLSYFGRLINEHLASSA